MRTLFVIYLTYYDGGEGYFWCWVGWWVVVVW